MADLIKRQDAIDALLEEVRLVDGYYIENDEVIDKDDAIEAIRLLPSAHPDEIGIQLAYMRGKIDGIKECTEKLRKLREEFE